MDPTVAEAIDALVRLRGGVSRREGRVALDLRDQVAHVVIDNPSARHALTLGMMEDLGRAVQSLQGWDGVAVVLRASTPDAFCAGGHLGQVRDALGRPEAGRVMAQAMGAITDALFALPMVSVAWVQGPAVGGGAELTTATDHRVFAPSAWVQFRQAALAVGAGWGGARRLRLHVRDGTALRWLTTAARVDASVAHRAGYADVVADDASAEAVDAWLAPVLGLPAAGVRTVKQQLALARDGAGREADVDAFVATWGGPAHRGMLER